MLKTVNETLIVRGDLAARASLLSGRLEKKEYRPATILTMDKDGWPGDWEGRTILALVRLAETTKKEPAWLHEIVRAVLAGRNERGYLGHILPEGEADEQQLSGHSWLLRGLIAYYRYTKDQAVYDAVVTIGRALFLPLIDVYPTYPILPEERVYAGAAAGNVAKKVRNWHISTDTGCAYIPLDGVSDLYALTGDPEIGRLLDVMILNFKKIDFLGICVQTHATLTATRGILRTYEMTGDPSYLSTAESLFSMYRDHGMTANYANYNWFGRPEWTEPCAIIDSFIVAIQLYRFTGKRDYITYAQRIYFNGMGFGQRENGGFGCDTCLGADTKENSHILHVAIEEASWCCSMRGGEGLASVAEHLYLTDAEKRLVVLPLLASSQISIPMAEGLLSLSQRTAYPYEGRVSLTVNENTVGADITLALYLPDTAEDITVSGAAYTVGDGMLYLTVTEQTKELQVSFVCPIRAEETEGLHNDKTRRALFVGNMMLSARAEAEELRLPQNVTETGDDRLHPLFDAYEEGHCDRQVLFAL